MEKINWPNYTGEQFQLFCNSLLSMEVGKHFMPFNAPGKDGGIDGRFEGVYDEREGLWRFQYKFHSVSRKEGFRLLKSDLKKEMLKTGDEQYFVFMTNVELLPQELAELHADWDDAGIETYLEVWDGAKLFTLYLRYPLLELWMAEGFNTAQLQDYKTVFKQSLESGYEDPGTFNIAFISRGKEIAILRNFFLGNEKIALLSGEAGIGKTRLAIEFFRQVVDTSKDWSALVLMNRNIDFDRIRKSLSGDKKYIILIDDAHNFSPETIADMQQLAEVMNGNMKLILTARLLLVSTSLKLIRENVQQKILQVKLDALSREDTQTLLTQHLSENYYSFFLSELVNISHGKPILIVAIIRAARSNISIQEVKKDHFLSQYVSNYFDAFYTTVIADTGTTKLKLQKLLQFICLIEPFNFADSKTATRLSDLVGTDLDTVKFVLENLKKAGLASGRYLQSIKPDYYSDMLLMAADSAAIIKALPELMDFLSNVITNLASVDEVRKEPDSVLDMILNLYIQNIKESTPAAATNILETVTTITYAKPEIAAKAVDIYLDALADNNNLLHTDINTSRSYHLQSGESTTGRIKRILFDLLYYPKQYDFVFVSAYKLATFLGDNDKVAAHVFDYARRDYIENFKLKRQDHFVSSFTDGTANMDERQLFFAISCCEIFLKLDYTDTTWDGAQRDTLTITTYYLPNTTAVKKLREKIIRFYAALFTQVGHGLIKDKLLSSILDIPRSIFATTHNKTLYSGDSEIEMVLDFLVAVSTDLSAMHHKDVLDKIFWYRRWGIKATMLDRLDQIQRLLTPQNLTESLVHLFTRTELLLTDAAEQKLREQSRVLIEKFPPEELADSIITLTTDKQNFFHYFLTFTKLLNREFPDRAKIVYTSLWGKSRPTIYQFGGLFLADFYFFHHDHTFYLEKVKQLEEAKYPDADNIILRVYGSRDFKTGEIMQADIEIINTIAIKKEPKNNFDLARALPAVIVYDEIVAKELCSGFLQRCGYREAEIFFVFMAEKMDDHYEVCRWLLLEHSALFPVAYEIEKGLNKIVLREGIAPIVDYFRLRFALKKAMYVTKQDSIGYDWAPDGNHSHLFDNCSNGEREDFFFRSVDWYSQMRDEFIYIFFAKQLLHYARPSNQMSAVVSATYQERASAVAEDAQTLTRVLETISVFHDKDSNLIRLVLDQYALACNRYGNNPELLKSIRSACYEAITTMGVKSGTAGQPFAVDLELHELLKAELLLLPEYSLVYNFLQDVIKQVNINIEREYEKGNNEW